MKRKAALLLAGCLLTGLLAACGGGTDTPANEVSQGTPAVTEENEGETGGSQEEDGGAG